MTHDILLIGNHVMTHDNRGLLVALTDDAIKVKVLLLGVND